MKGCVCSGVFIGSHAHVPAVAVIGSYDQRILDTNLGDSGFSALLGIGPAARPGAAGGCWRPRRSPRKRRTNLAVSSLGERQFRGYDAERFRTARRSESESWTHIGGPAAAVIGFGSAQVGDRPPRSRPRAFTDCSPCRSGNSPARGCDRLARRAER